MLDDQPNPSSIQRYRLIIGVVLEPFFVFLVLTFIFFTLNYLNILSLGRTFPFLSSLPHLPQTPSSPQSSSADSLFLVKPNPFASPTLEPLSPQEQAIMSYAAQVLRPTYLPQESMDTSKFAASTLGPNAYVLTWGVFPTAQTNGLGGGKITATVDGSTVTAATVAFSTSYSLTPVTPDVANQFVQAYFQVTHDMLWNCAKESSVRTSCTFEVISNGQKVKYYLYTTSEIPNRVFAHYCFASNQVTLFKQKSYCLF